MVMIMSISARWKRGNLQNRLHVFFLSAVADVAHCIQQRSIFLTTCFLLKY